MEKIAQKDILLSLLTAPAVPATSSGDSGSGIVPAGTKTVNITANGETVTDVTQYEKVKVVADIPVGVFPDGVLEIAKNGDYNVTEKKSVSVNVPIGITPEGTKEIAKNGVYDVTEFASVNVNVPAAGITPEGTKSLTITENGTVTEDVSTYKNVEVTVAVQASGGTEDKTAAFLDGTITAYSNSELTEIREKAFYGCIKMTSVDLPNVTTLGADAFNTCKWLETVNIPKLTALPYQCFYYGFSLPDKLVFPVCKSVAGYVISYAETKTLDILGGGQIDSYAFYRASYFTTLILRNTETVTKLQSAPSSVWQDYTSVTVYVPDALLENYKTATNWVKMAGQIKALSEYKGA